DYGVGLAGTCVNLGIQVEAGKRGGGLALFERAVAVLEAVLQRDPKHALARSFLRNARLMRARTLAGLGRYAEAVRDFDWIIDLEGSRSHPMVRLMRATTLAHGGQHARAAAEVDALARGASDQGLLYNLACVQALAARAAEKDAKLSEAERGRLAGQ